MELTSKQRRRLPACTSGHKNHAWKKGAEKFEESGICAHCGYDSFDDLHRSVEE